MADQNTAQKILASFGVIFLLTANGFFLQFAMLRQFDSNDYGGLIDAGWRIMHGQKPYVDFLYHAQPFFIYAMAWFFMLFGFTKAAFLSHMLFVSSGMILMTYFMVRQRASAFLAFVAAGLTAVGFHWHYPFPNFTFDAIFWGTMGLFALAAQTPFRSARAAFWTSALCSAAAGISFMNKANMGAAFGLVFLMTVLISEKKAAAIGGYLSGGLIAALGSALLIPDMGRFFFANSDYLASQHVRLFMLLRPESWLENGYWVPVLVVVLNFYGRPLAAREPAMLFLGVAFVAIVSLSTGSWLLPSHIPFMGAAVGLGFVLLEEMKSFSPTPMREAARRGSVKALIVIALMQGAQTGLFSFQAALGQQPSGSQLHIEKHDYVLQSKPLDGWRCPRRWGEPLDHAVDFIKQNVPQQESLVVLTQMQILYSLTGRESFRGMPFQFVPQIMPAPGRQTEEVEKAVMEQPPDWIVTYQQGHLFHKRFYAVLPELEKYVQAHYALVQSWSPYVILRRL